MAHLSSPQAQRTLKFITGVACTFVGFQSVFLSKYETIEGFEGKDHIFTHVQRDARDFFDRNVYGIDVDAIRERADRTTAVTTTTTANNANAETIPEAT